MRWFVGAVLIAGAAIAIVFAQTGALNVVSGTADLTGITTRVATQSAGDATTKAASTSFVTTAVNNAIAGVNPAVAVTSATTGVLPNSPTYNNGASGVGATLTAGSAAALTVDGYTPVLNDRILVKNQGSALQNGVYTLSTLGTGLVPYVLTRATDFNQPSNINSTGAIPVVNGTANGSTQWVLTSTVNAVGTDAITFTQFSLNPATIMTTTTALSLGQTPLTTRGDLLTVDATPALKRLAKCSQYQTVQGGASDTACDAVHLDQSAATTGILGSAGGGTGNGFFAVSGPASTTKTFTFPNASSTVSYTVASGTSALGTSAISSATCATVVTTSATGTATTDVITAGFNGDPTGVTGYVPLTSGMLTIIAYPTADNVNFKVCNNTSASITPGAITLNWRVAR